MAESLNDQLFAQLRAGEQAVAKENYQEAEKIFREALGFASESKRATVELTACLARVCTADGRLLDARAYYEKILEMQADISDIKPVEIARSRLSLAYACEKLGDLKEAAEQMKLAFCTFRENLGPQHPETMGCLKRSIAIHDAIRKKQSLNKLDVSWSG